MLIHHTGSGRLQPFEKTPFFNNTMSAQKGRQYTHFLKWDDGKKGGRWFECAICQLTVVGKKANSDHVLATCHDGDQRLVRQSELVPIAGRNARNGDNVIAYWDDRKYAFAGKVNGTRVNELYVEFADGDEAWISANKVYRR